MVRQRLGDKLALLLVAEVNGEVYAGGEARQQDEGCRTALHHAGGAHYAAEGGAVVVHDDADRGRACAVAAMGGGALGGRGVGKDGILGGAERQDEGFVILYVPVVAHGDCYCLAGLAGQEAEPAGERQIVLPRLGAAGAGAVAGGVADAGGAAGGACQADSEHEVAAFRRGYILLDVGHRAGVVVLDGA